jgi:hypothetical protein
MPRSGTGHRGSDAQLPALARLSRSDGTVSSGAGGAASANAHLEINSKPSPRGFLARRPTAAEVRKVFHPGHLPTHFVLEALPGRALPQALPPLKAILSRSAGHHRGYLRPMYATRGAVPSNPSLESGRSEAARLGRASASRIIVAGPAKPVHLYASAQLER